MVYADHQNRADIGANIARQWYERDGVDPIIDIPNSSVALAGTGDIPEAKEAADRYRSANDRADERPLLTLFRSLGYGHICRWQSNGGSY